ncbi:DUF6221 family protein [Streptomyces sp. 1222.5]|uniref:DUF6221 family protein n=1 Tax=Streptomyces sp. 1222.5 TaxID=1881026 RepID=UPI003D706648
MSDELAQFLRDRINEESGRPAALRTIASLIPDGVLLRETADQIEAESIAKRRLVSLCSYLDHRLDGLEGWDQERPFLKLAAKLFLQRLALPYAQHPSYRAEWRADPEGPTA